MPCGLYEQAFQAELSTKGDEYGCQYALQSNLILQKASNFASMKPHPAK
jgi:hypothetical protein